MYRHVLCVYPYRRERERGDGFYPPLGIEMIATVLKPHAGTIDIVDLRHEAGRTTDFLRPETDLVCFSVNWDREHDSVRREIRSVPKHLFTVMGGRHATEAPEEWLAECPNVDILVRGDGEETIDEVARGGPLQEISGISYRLDGHVVHGPTRKTGPVRNDLWPDRDLRRYTYSLAPRDYRTGLTVDSIASSRGCPFNCKFCSFNRNPWGEKRPWTARSPESVVREIGEIGSKFVIFVDDLATHDMDRMGAICDLLLDRGIRKRYAVCARAEVARRPDVLRKMERAGFSFLLLGIESAQDKTLRSMRKGFDTRLLRQYFHVLRKTRMIVHGSFLIGNIGETEEEMLEIAPFARELGLDSLVLCPLRNDRHSGLEKLLDGLSGYHTGHNRWIYSDRYPLEHLRRIRHQVYRSFYGDPGQILRILIKGVRNGVLTAGTLAKLPWYFARETSGHMKRKRAHLKHSRPAERATQGARL